MKQKEKITSTVKVGFDDASMLTLSKLANKEGLSLSEFIRKYMILLMYGLASSIDE